MTAYFITVAAIYATITLCGYFHTDKKYMDIYIKTLKK